MPRSLTLTACLAMAAALSGCADPPLTIGQPRQPEGQLRITIQVVRGNLAPGGSAISLNGGEPMEVAGSTILALAPGRYTLDLVGLPQHCAPSESARRSVDIEPAEETVVTFAVDCEQLRTGLNVLIGSVGDDRDDRYRVLVCAQISCATILFERDVASDSLITLDLVPGRYYFVRVYELADNCDPPTTLAGYVAPNQVAELRVTITCWKRAWFRARVTVTGVDIDREFRILVNSLDMGAISDSAPVLIRSVATHRTIALTQVAANCRITSAHPQGVQLSGVDTLDVNFGVECTALPTLRVTVTATGVNVPDSLYVGVDFDPWQLDYVHWGTVPTNATTDLKFPLADGPHQVWLDGLRAGCTVQEAMPVGVTTLIGAVTPVSFSVVCL